MSATGEIDNLAVEQPAAEVAAVEQSQPVEKAVNEKKTKAPKEKKPKAPKEKKPRTPKTASHPPYFQMIKDALLSLNEKTGSSPYAIAKYMEEKLKAVLPANFRKILGLQLKNSVAKGKLIKIRASYKLSEAGKKESGMTKTPPKAATTEAKKPKKAAAAKGRVGEKRKAAKGKVGEKRKAETEKKAGKKSGPKKTRKSAAAVKPKQPRSIKFPGAKRARKATT